MKTIPENKPIRVGIRGIAGLLGFRFALDILHNRDMEIAFGVVKNDSTLQKLLTATKKMDKKKKIALIGEKVSNNGKGKIYMDETQETVNEVNRSQSVIAFEYADQLPSFPKRCDVIIDTIKAQPDQPSQHTREEQEKLNDKYRTFRKPVILQSGEFPRGRLISPPLIEPESARTQEEPNIYRQGDCILSGIMPILAAIQDIAKRIRLNVVMQRDEKLYEYPTLQSILGMYLSDTSVDSVEEQLRTLFPSQDPEVDSVIQIPSHDYYTSTIHIEVERGVTHKDVRKLLEGKPRIHIAPDNIRSTSEVDRYIRESAQMLGKNVSPITVYGGLLRTRERRDRTLVRIQSAIYSRMAAVLPNIDAVRILARGMPPAKAMRITDRNMKLI